ncbi:hypothetical protein BGZ65_001789 [Modicella reniformis]|uniref:F-box domain-containing protein n=1 Tax=Modicella reniformis TaxID=1440133 RepID=A0A9P6LSC0_9FUNG|nr:hypothetical protein BGZ65_001789 [Modicella reniformis]
MESVKPLDLPEIQHYVAGYLNKKELLQCILVCKSWNQSFLPYLWESIKAAWLVVPGMNNDENKLTQVTSPEVLQRHSHLVKTVHISRQSHKQYTIRYPNLRSLNLMEGYWYMLCHVQVQEDQEEETDDAVEKKFTALITLNPTIIRLNITNLPWYYSADFWTAVSEGLPHLRELSVAMSTIQDESSICAFWSTCVRLETIDFNDSTIPSFATITNDMTFASIRKLHLMFVRVLDVEEQLDLITRCQNLEDLLWAPVLSEGTEVAMSDKFKIIAEAGTWPKLTALSVYFQMQDKDLASILESRTTPLRKFEFQGAAYGTSTPPFHCTYRIIHRHFHTLVHLDIRYTTALTSPMHQEILSSCPSLDWFSGGDFAARDALDGEPWVCQWIRTFRVHFVFEDHEQHLQPLIFKRLSKLFRLEDLGGGFDNRETRGLDFRLSSGLGALSTLTRLRDVHVGVMQSVGFDEIEWAIVHWTERRQLFGSINADEAITIALKQRLRESIIPAS